MRAAVPTPGAPANPEVVVVVTEALVGPAVDRWAGVVDRAADERPRRLVLDVVRCPRIDAAAIVYLLQLHRRMVCADGELVVRNPARPVRHMLALGRVDHVLDLQPATADGP